MSCTITYYYSVSWLLCKTKTKFVGQRGICIYSADEPRVGPQLRFNHFMHSWSVNSSVAPYMAALESHARISLHVTRLEPPPRPRPGHNSRGGLGAKTK